MAIYATIEDGMGQTGTLDSTGNALTAFTGVGANDFTHISEDFLADDGVVSGLTCVQNGTPDRSVDVNAGTGYILNTDWTANNGTVQKYHRFVNTADVNVAIDANASGNDRYTSIFAKYDTSATPDDNASNVVTFVAVNGTPAASPTVPDAPSDGNYYLRLADVLCENGFSAITTSEIIDRRETTGLQLHAGAQGLQAIINGNFDIWQRGASFTNPASLAYTADRYKVESTLDGGTAPTLTHTRQVLTSGDIPNSFFHYRVATNGAGTSYGNSSEYCLEQFIENGVRNLCGLNKKVTLSFYARSSIANKKLGVYLEQRYGSGGSPTAIEGINGTNWTLTSSWTKYEYTFTTNTLVGKTFGTSYDDALNCRFYLQWGSTIAARVGDTVAESFVGSGNIDIAQVQLNAGDEALEFNPKSFEEELAACQRYYEKTFDIGTAPAQATGSNAGNLIAIAAGTGEGAAAIQWHFRVLKRIAPAITLYSVDAMTDNWTGTGTPASIYDWVGTSGARIRTTGGGVVDNAQYVIHATANAEI